MSGGGSTVTAEYRARGAEGGKLPAVQLQRDEGSM